MYINLLEDSLFKRIMQNNKRYLSTIISQLIKEISYEKALKGYFINTELIKPKVYAKKKITDLIYKIDNYYINLEANTSYSKELIIKNTTYIKKMSIQKILVNNKYDDNQNKYIQINFNLFSMPKSNEIINKYEYSDIVNKISLKDNTTIYHINIAMIKNMAYNNSNKLNQYLKVLSAKDISEIDVKGDEIIMDLKKDVSEYYEEDGLGVYDFEEANCEFVFKT